MSEFPEQRTSQLMSAAREKLVLRKTLQRTETFHGFIPLDKLEDFLKLVSLSGKIPGEEPGLEKIERELRLRRKNYNISVTLMHEFYMKLISSLMAALMGSAGAYHQEVLRSSTENGALFLERLDQYIANPNPAILYRAFEALEAQFLALEKLDLSSETLDSLREECSMVEMSLFILNPVHTEGLTHGE